MLSVALLFLFGFVLLLLIVDNEKDWNWSTTTFLQIVIGLGAIVASGSTGRESLPVGEAWGVTFFVAAVFLSWLWKRRFRHGPLEWVMRQVAG